jgi:hypothetical protein
VRTIFCFAIEVALTTALIWLVDQVGTMVLHSAVYGEVCGAAFGGYLASTFKHTIIHKIACTITRDMQIILPPIAAILTPFVLPGPVSIRIVTGLVIAVALILFLPNDNESVANTDGHRESK